MTKSQTEGRELLKSTKKCNISTIKEKKLLLPCKISNIHIIFRIKNNRVKN